MKTWNVEQIKNPVSAIGMGTMIFHPDTKDRDFGLLDAFIQNGGTYVDTAEVYGAVEEHGYSEIVIGEWLKNNHGVRDKIILATKGLITGYCAPLHPGGAVIDPPSIHRAIDGSLQRLQTDTLDIWMFHRDNKEYPVGPLVDALDEEIKKGKIKAYGASNWSVERIQEAINYAKQNNKTPMMSSSPNFSLAKANEPFWPDTVVTTQDDKKWFEKNNFLLVAWSALGRGFFAKGNPDDKSDEDLVRTFYSDQNFERKKRAEELAKTKSLTMFEVALAYVINQEFPVVALNGAETVEQVQSSTKAGGITMSSEERDWIDLVSDQKPF